MKTPSLLVLSLIAACIMPTGLDDVEIVGAERLRALPRWFHIGYDQTVECLELADPRPFEWVEWYVADDIRVNDRPDDFPWRTVGGLWIGPSNIYLLRSQYERTDTVTVRHELIHYLFQGGHDVVADSVFERCENPNYICEELEGGVQFCYWRKP